ncbi:MAG: hypothetical protein RLZZ624_162 [Cyanobacteriota bacterium]
MAFPPPTMAPASPQSPVPAISEAAPIHRWIKTDCGRAKYAELAARSGAIARLRLGWFVAIAALRDWPLPNPDQPS